MRNRVTFFLFILMIFSACQREIVLRVEPVESVPFSKDQKTGEYNLTFYRLNYPEELTAKEKFYSDLNISLKKLFIKDKKRDVIISEKFYEDYILISEGKLLAEEEIFEKVASNLTELEKKSLKKIVNFKLPKFSNTIQEYLNFQVYYLLKILNKSDSFDSEKIYTEREKNDLILEIKSEREEIAKLIAQMELNMILNIVDPYAQEEKAIYWDDVDINLNKSGTEIRSDLAKYELPIYVENLTSVDFSKILIGDALFSNDVVIVKNERFIGYLYDTTKKRFTFLVGGNQEKHRFSDYAIKIEIKEIDFTDLIVVNEEYILTDFIGGNK